MTDNKPISKYVHVMEKMADILMDEANAEIEQLRKERDEARRLYCEEAFAHRFNERGGLGPITDPKQIAQGMKWDCFKEDTND